MSAEITSTADTDTVSPSCPFSVYRPCSLYPLAAAVLLQLL